jgi:asparagine synthase (glutamine-hydrolysing)
MCYADRYWITYNGEIYNYPEIRNELIQKGYSFRSGTDTEVVLAAYAAWGPDCLSRFNGMWAFVIYDAERRELFFARDRFGIKPLHYYRDAEFFVFASEIKAILRHPGVRSQPSIDYCREYLRNGPREYIAETAFSGIWRFPHASYALTSVDALLVSGVRPVRYWTLTPNLSREEFRSEKAVDYAEEYRRLLSDAVRIRLRADVKVGSALSGGLDSSSIVAFVNEALRNVDGHNDRQATFSTIYPDPRASACDESDYISITANRFGVVAHTTTPVIATIPDECYKNIYAMDNPPESSCMSAWHTFKLVASTDVRVTLDGQGADEQLAGYLKYLAPYVGQSGHPWSSEVTKLSAVPGAKKYLRYGFLIRAARGLVPTSLWRTLTHGQISARQTALDDFNEILVQDIQSGLVNLLHFADRTSMAHSIESRMPFMDYRLVEFLASVPFRYKIHEGWTKYIARVAMQDILPNSIVWRRDKLGWAIPEDYWFRGPLREWLCERVDRSPLLRALGVGRDIRNDINGPMRIRQIMRLLNLALWYEVFFESQPVMT